MIMLKSLNQFSIEIDYAIKEYGTGYSTDLNFLWNMEFLRYRNEGNLDAIDSL